MLGCAVIVHSREQEDALSIVSRTWESLLWEQWCKRVAPALQIVAEIFLLIHKICRRPVFKWFGLRSTVACLFLRHCAFSHCLLMQSDSSVDSARLCGCTPCLEVFQKSKGLGNNKEAGKDHGGIRCAELATKNSEVDLP